MIEKTWLPRDSAGFGLPRFPGANGGGKSFIGCDRDQRVSVVRHEQKDVNPPCAGSVVVRDRFED